MSKEHMIAVAERHNSHFFDRDTMRFFSSRILESTVYPLIDPATNTRDGNYGYAFVSSEDNGRSGRKYTVRTVLFKYDDETYRKYAEHEDIGGFQAHDTAYQAKEALAEFVKTH